MAETPLGKLIVELGMNTAKFDEGITKTQKQLGAFNKAIKSAKEEVKLYGEGSEAATNQLNLMSKAYAGNKQLLSDYSNQLAKQKTKLSETKSALESNRKALADNATVVENLKQKNTLLKDSIHQAAEAIKKDKKATDEQKNALKKLKQELAENEKLLKERKSASKELETVIGDLSAKEQRYGKDISVTESHMVRIQGTMAKLKAEYKGLAKAQSEARNPLIQTGTRWEESGKRSTESGNKILNVSRAFAPLTAAIGAVAGAGFGLATKAATDYETAITNVRKTTDPTAKQLKEFEEGFRKLSKTIPVSASELANMGGIAGQLGIKNENLLGFVETMAKLQTATNIVGEEGAADLAKFMNVMNTGQDKISNLASSIVELGNNFATTERDILSMSQRLAGVGHAVGLSEGDVLGVATALSSVGIEAEKGGTAFSTLMTTIANSVETGGNKLEGFASVAGMSAQDFAAQWKDSPVKALAAIVEGLGTASEKNETAIALLGEMGIKQSRLREVLLNSGGAYKLFNTAVETGNKAFKENTALQREFNTFSETTASKWEIFKNSLTDVAIELGNKLLPSIKNMLDNSGPFVDGIKDMIEGFINLPDPIKKVAGALVLFSAGFSPVLGMIGHLQLFKGLFGEALGGFLKTKGMAQVAKQSFDIVGTSVTGVANAAVSASGAVGGIGTAASSSTGLLSGLISLPVLGWAAGITAALGLGYAAWKAWGEEAWNASQETKRHEETVKQWGVDVGEKVDATLEKMQNFANESQIYLEKGLTVTPETQEKATVTTTKMFDSMRQALEEHFQETQKIYEKLPETAQASAQKEFDKRKEKIDEAKQYFENGEKRINEIYEAAGKERRKLTELETAEINSIRTKAQAELAKALTNNGSDAQKLFENMTESMAKLSEKQLNERVTALTKLRDEEIKGYSEQQKNLENALSAGLLSYSDYHKEVKALEEQHHETMKGVALQHYNTLREQQKRYQESGQTDLAEAMEQGIQNVLKTYGVTVEQMDALSKEKERIMSERNKWLANSVKSLTGTISEETEKANAAWEALITDEKTGHIVDNIDAVIKKATESEDGWNNLKFIIQNATLNTNAQETIQQALVDSGKWNELSWEEKKLLLKTDAISEAQEKAIEVRDLWNNTEFTEQLLKIDTTAPDAAEKIQDLLQQYGIAADTLQQSLIAETSTNAPETQGQVDAFTQAVVGVQNVAKQGAELKTGTDAPDTQAKVENLTKKINEVPKETTTKAKVDTRSADASLNGLLGRLGNFANSVFQAGASIVTSIFRNATGNPYFEGGLTFLGDGKRREPFLTPDGHFGVSPATDTLYALPRGTKIWPSVGHFRNDAANDSRLLPYLPYIPKYATGTPLSFLDSRVPNVFQPNQTATNSQTSYNDNSTYSPVLKIENFHANSDIDVETLFKKFAWLTKREEDREW